LKLGLIDTTLQSAAIHRVDKSGSTWFQCYILPTNSCSYWYTDEI